MEWLFLALAIFLEIGATTLLKLSDEFTNLPYAIGSLIGYTACFYLLSLSLRKIELGVAYAIWSAAGITVLALIGIFLFKESVSVMKVVSLLFIILGVVGLNLSGAGH